MEDRRAFLGSLALIGGALVDASAASTGARPQLGVVTSAVGDGGPARALANVKELGFTTCQLGVGPAPASLAGPIRDAAQKNGVTVTALMTLGEGKMVWTLKDGPLTIGLVPRATRQNRIDALKRASDLAKLCGVSAVQTHCGFIPERPDDPLYPETLKAIGEVARHLAGNGHTLLCETGQESPITLLRVIQDLNMSNVAVNMDLANLILYGKGEPVGALDVLGKHVRGVHAKDGFYPTDPYGLGEEVAIGQGKVRFREVFRKFRDLSYTGAITIEREISGSRQRADILASKKFLQDLIDHEYGA